MALEPRRKPLKENTSTKNVLLLATSAFEAESYKVLSLQPKCIEQSSCAGTTFTISQSTIDSKNDTPKFLLIFLRASRLKKETWLQSASAGIQSITTLTLLKSCRPLSKTVRFNVLKVSPQKIEGLQKKKQFRAF